MRGRPIGRTGIPVGRLILGCGNFGGALIEPAALEEPARDELSALFSRSDSQRSD